MGYNRIDSIFCRSQVFFFQFFLVSKLSAKVGIWPLPGLFKVSFFHFENMRLLVHLFLVVVVVGVGGGEERERITMFPQTSCKQQTIS